MVKLSFLFTYVKTYQSPYICRKLLLITSTYELNDSIEDGCVLAKFKLKTLNQVGVPVVSATYETEARG